MPRRCQPHSIAAHPAPLLGGILLALLAAAALLAGAAAEPSPAPAPAAIVYQSHYDDPANLAHWSLRQTDKSKRLMLGRFYNVTESLSLSALPPHAFVRLKAQIFILDSWDGNNPGDGPDQIAIRLGDGRSLLQATFVPYPKGDPRVDNPPLQSFPDNYGTGSFPGLTGASDHDVNWLPRATEQWGANAVYPVEFTFPHSAADLRLDFISSLVDSDPTIKNESWGLGDVEVALLDAAPVTLHADQVLQLVSDLGADDPLVANRAIGTLISAGDAAIDPIRQALVALRPAPGAHVADLIRQLDDDRFTAREAAQRELEAGGPDVIAQCTAALEAGVSPEVESRLQQILAKSKSPTVTIRDRRLARVLEIIGGDNALALRKQFDTFRPLPDLNALRQVLQVTGNEEWAVLSVKISRVLALLNDPRYGPVLRDVMTRSDSAPEMQSLRQFLQGPPVSEVTLKNALSRLRAQRIRSGLPVDPSLQNGIAQARSDLTKVLTVRQEAILVSLNILE